MNTMNDLGIVVPAYNEEASIAETVRAIKQHCADAKLLVVNDCSIDDTGKIAAASGAEVLTNPVNYNYGKGLRVGFKHLIDSQKVKYLAFLDADGTYQAEDIPGMYKIICESDIAMIVGSRLMSNKTGMPGIRKAGNKMFAGLLSFYSKKHMSDIGSGLRIVKAEITPLFENLPDNLSFTPAMSAMVAFRDIKFSEVPIQYKVRIGNSKLSSFKDGFRFWKAVMEPARQYRPGLFYCTLGIPFLVFEQLIKLFSIEGK
jgi:glycosyltransferase involved in cell wall biosynthesis